MAHTNSSGDRHKHARKEKALYVTALVAFIAAYYPAFVELMWHWYESDDNSYGFFILPCSLYFIFKNRQRWADIPTRTSMTGAVAFTLALLLYLFGQFAEIDTVAYLGLVLTIWSGVWFLFGLPILKVLAFPLGLLLLMIPVPAQIYSLATVPLQLLVSHASAGIAQLLGIPLYREGNVLILPNHTLAVVQACSGLRSLMAMITLCILYGYLTLRSNWMRAVLVCCAVPSALLANILRVTLMVISYYHFDYDLADGTAHSAFGIFIFVIGMLAIVFVKGVLSRWDMGKHAR